MTISNALNSFFYNVPSDLASKLPEVDHHFSSYMRGKDCNFFFTKVSEVEVFLLLETTDTKKSFGIDKVHPLLLSSAAF